MSGVQVPPPLPLPSRTGDRNEKPLTDQSFHPPHNLDFRLRGVPVARDPHGMKYGRRSPTHRSTHCPRLKTCRNDDFSRAIERERVCRSWCRFWRWRIVSPPVSGRRSHSAPNRWHPVGRPPGLLGLRCPLLRRRSIARFVCAAIVMPPDPRSASHIRSPAHTARRSVSYPLLRDDRDQRPRGHKRTGERRD